MMAYPKVVRAFAYAVGFAFECIWIMALFQLLGFVFLGVVIAYMWLLTQVPSQAELIALAVRLGAIEFSIVVAGIFLFIMGWIANEDKKVTPKKSAGGL